MRATLQHPEIPGMVAAYGWDRALSWWCEVRASGRLLAEYAAITCGQPTSPAGILRVLVEHDFFTEGDVHEAREWLAVVGEVEWITDPGAKRAAEVISKLKEAGGSG